MKKITQSKEESKMTSIFNQSTQYQKALLGILSEVNVNNCNDSLKEDLKSVYQLLNLLNQVSTTKPKTV